MNAIDNTETEFTNTANLRFAPTATAPMGGTARALRAAGRAAEQPLNVWLVDDSVEIRGLVADLLACSGLVRPKEFNSPKPMLEALAQADSKPDAILLDIHMGDENGLDAIRPIKALSRSTRVLMFTTFFDDTCKARALREGASDFLLKSYSVEEILTHIEAACTEPEAPMVQAQPAQREVPATGRPWLERMLGFMRAPARA
jgi:DNA-binding NtrC family response regulator